MAFLPVPDEVREMQKEIDHLIDRMLMHDRLISQLIGVIDAAKSDNAEVKQLALDIQETKLSLDLIKDSVWLGV